MVKREDLSQNEHQIRRRTVKQAREPACIASRPYIKRLYAIEDQVRGPVYRALRRFFKRLDASALKEIEGSLDAARRLAKMLHQASRRHLDFLRYFPFPYEGASGRFPTL